MNESPTYDLSSIKRVFSTTDKLKMTATAMNSQYMLGFSDQDVVDAIQSLTSFNFYKSMPPIKAGFTAWQDVYKTTFKQVNLYIKFQIDNKGETIVSFKKNSGKTYE